MFLENQYNTIFTKVSYMHIYFNIIYTIIFASKQIAYTQET